MNKEKKRLLEIIDRFPGKKIIVWGDFILDEYLYGYTRRISREAPVLILSYRNTTFSLGGAGNSLLNLHSLDSAPIPVGLLGTNSTGEEVLHTINEYHIPTKYLIKDKSYSTPSKTRVLAGDKSTRKQQILRIDKESRVPETKSIKNSLYNALKNLVQKADAVLISDYHYFNVKKDIYDEMIPHFQNTGIPVTLDSRYRLLDFKNSTVATPNEKEAKRTLGIDVYNDSLSIEEIGENLLKKIRSKFLIITRGSKGMVVFQNNKDPYHINIYGTDEIVNVAGAGDTVISTITLALSTGAEIEDAAKIANYAAGIVVMKEGTSTLSRKELKEAIVSEN